MTTFSEADVERAALEWLSAANWQIARGSDIAPGAPASERDDFWQVVLKGRLCNALDRLNPELQAGALHDALQRLMRPEGATLEARNRAFHRMIADGVRLEYRRPNMMFLEQIDIANFRGIRQLRLKLDNTTVLIGKNNTGKTTILEALQFCLSRSLTRKGGIFSEYDYHLPQQDSQPADSDAIEITLRFAEQVDGEWADEVLGRLSNAVQVDDNDRKSAILRVRSEYDQAMDDFVTTWDFLNFAGDKLINAKDPRHLGSLQQLVPVFYLAALRESAQEFRPRSQFWGPFVRSLNIAPELRRELEGELATLNQKILDAHESFDAIKEQLGNTGKMLPLHGDDPVGIEAVPSKVFAHATRQNLRIGQKSRFF